MPEEPGDEDCAGPFRRLRDAGCLDGRQPQVLEVEEDAVLASSRLEWQLLQRVQDAVRDQEADEVSGWPDGDEPESEAVAGPVGQRQLPGQLDEIDRGVAQA